jgi:uncharacterized protein YndB with AHSA1/START domain
MKTMNQTTLELRGDREIVIERTFNGPAQIVFDAWTRPELVERWWAPQSRGVAVVACTADVRVGGAYRYHLRHRNGEFAFGGEYLEVTPPTRLVYTQVYEPTASGPAEGDVATTNTVTFTERDGRTHVVAHTHCPTAALRDAIIASGMESGMKETMDQLDAVVESLAV